jgi:hypothetical protein
MSPSRQHFVALLGTALMSTVACKTSGGQSNVKDESAPDAGDSGEAGAASGLTYHCVETHNQDDPMNLSIVSSTRIKWADMDGTPAPFTGNSPNAAAFNRFAISVDEGVGHLLVAKTLFDAGTASGQVRFQVQTDGFINETFNCKKIAAGATPSQP